MKVAATLAGLVPAKATLGVILGLLVTGWFGGVGFTVGFGETSASIKMVPEIKATLELHDLRFVEVEARLERAEASSSRMMCLMELTATGERVLAVELDRTVRECQQSRQGQ